MFKKNFVFLSLVSTVFFAACSSGSNNQVENQISIPGLNDPVLIELTRLIESDPGNPDHWYRRAQAFYERDGYDEAIGDMSAAMSIDTVNRDYHLFLSDVYMGYYKSRLALNTLLRASVLFPEDKAVLLKLSKLQIALKLYKESMTTLDQILRLDPQNADAFVLLGINYREEGDTAMAIGAFQKAVNMDADQIDGWINLGKLRAARNEPNAIRFFDAAILADTGHVAQMAKAEFLWDEKRFSESIDLYGEILQKNASNTDALYNLGLVYMEIDSFKKAHEHFNITLNINPLYYKAFYYRGLASEKLGDTTAAMRDYEHCIKLAPNFDKPKTALEALSK